MKIKVTLLLMSLSACAALTAIYMRGESKLSRGRESVVGTFERLHLLETEIQKDVLRARSFLVNNYDDMVRAENQLHEICSDLSSPKSHLQLYGHLSSKLDESIDSYCSNVDAMISLIESFKSKNAIVRNSMIYLTKAIEGREAVNNDPFAEDLVRLTFQYSFARGPESKAAVEKHIHKVRKTKGEWQLLVAHSSAILRNMEMLDSLVKDIVNHDQFYGYKHLEETYQSEYVEAESRAAVYRRILFALCLAMLACTVYAALRLWAAAKALAESNSALESRVEERTKALNLSLLTISEQQTQMVAAARMTALGEMAGQAAHEINTPLAALLLIADLIGKKVDAAEFNQPFYRKQLDLLVVITTKMGRIVSSMRKLSSGGREEVKSEAGVRQLVDETVVLCEGRFKRASIAFESKIEVGDLATMPCYPSEISQVLINLLNNAHDAVKKDDKRWVRLEVHETAQQITFRITDSGTGIPEGIREKIFETRFTTKTLDEGTGFGLSISRKIADRHNGRLYLDTTSPNTSFVLEIPRIEKELAHPSSAA